VQRIRDGWRHFVADSRLWHDFDCGHKILSKQEGCNRRRRPTHRNAMNFHADASCIPRQSSQETLHVTRSPHCATLSTPQRLSPFMLLLILLVVPALAAAVPAAADAGACCQQHIRDGWRHFVADSRLWHDFDSGHKMLSKHTMRIKGVYVCLIV